MDLELLKKELNLFMKWIDRSSHDIPNEDWMNEQNVESYMDSLEFKSRAWDMLSDESGASSRVIKSVCKCKNNSWNRDVGCFVCDDCGERI